MADLEEVAAGGCASLGCLLYIVYMLFYLAAMVFAGWTVLAWIGIVANYPWQQKGNMKKYMLYVRGVHYFNYWDGEHVAAECPEDVVKAHKGSGEVFMVGEIGYSSTTDGYETARLYGPFKRIKRQEVSSLEIKEVVV